MDDAFSRQEYPAMLASLQPVQAVSTLNDRVRRIATVNNEIADWLLERRKVEEIYVQGLRKLARKQPPDNQSELGIFTTPWQKIVSSMETIAVSHQTFATRIEKDVEQALRTFASKNREMQAMATIQGNLATMAKELEDAKKGAEKLSKKGSKANASKVDSAAQKLEAAAQQWDSQAPFVFEKLQAVDETRTNHLRDVLTQFMTHEADQVERSRINAETTLNSLLEVDTALEIHNFAQNVTQGRPRLERTPVQRTSSTTASSTLAPPGSSPSVDDDGSMHSGRQESSEPKGLKRFGTMLGRRRQSIHGAASFGRTPSPSKGAFGRSLGSRDGRPAPSPHASSNNLREMTSTDNRLSSLVESPSSPTGGVVASMNGTSNGITEEEHAAETDSNTVANGNTSKNALDLSDVKPPPGPPPSHLKNAAPLLDSEGFSMPSTNLDPISQAQLEAADESEQHAFKLDIRNEPIKEEESDAQAALSNVANTLRSSSLQAPSRKAGTIRGRRDVRNTIYVPAPEHDTRSTENIIPNSPGFQPGAGRAAALAALSSNDHHSVSDTNSIRSARSLTSSAAVKHPEMHEPGLNSSIIETVNAYFENGEVKSGAVIGEVALSYGSVESNALSGTETVRLNNFPALEAIAPNHTFVNEVSSDRPGEYTVDFSHLSKTTVAFRYKVHIDQTNLLAHTPVILKPAWRPQGDKLGVVIEYGLNAAFSASPITLHNFVLIAAYEGGKAAGCQTKPTGTHVKDKSLIYWRIGDVTVDNIMQRVIGRLIGSEGAELKPGLIEARWEFQSTAGKPSGSGLGISRLDTGKGKEKEEVDPFADESLATSQPAVTAEGQWVHVESARKIISGKYDSRQVVEGVEFATIAE